MMCPSKQGERAYQIGAGDEVDVHVNFAKQVKQLKIQLWHHAGAVWVDVEANQCDAHGCLHETCDNFQPRSGVSCLQAVPG